MFRLDLPPEQTADLAAALEDVVSQQPRHPTLAAALAAGVEGKQAYLAQEYVVGDSLDAVIRQVRPRRRWTPRWSRWVVWRRRWIARRARGFITARFTCATC